MYTHKRTHRHLQHTQLRMHVHTYTLTHTHTHIHVCTCCTFTLKLMIKRAVCPRFHYPFSSLLPHTSLPLSLLSSVHLPTFLVSYHPFTYPHISVSLTLPISALSTSPLLSVYLLFLFFTSRSFIYLSSYLFILSILYTVLIKILFLAFTYLLHLDVMRNNQNNIIFTYSVLFEKKSIQ